MSLPVKVTLEHFQRAHVREMQVGVQAQAETVNVPNLDHAFTIFERGGPAFTGRIDGRIIGCGGLVLFAWPGVAEAWVMASEHAPEYALSWHKTFQFLLQRMIGEYGLYRIQAEVQADFTRGRRWIEALGFQSEGEMPRFGPNRETFVRYAYLPQETV
jgi:RimJ/RimL family protein N-acetyltransferase